MKKTAFSFAIGIYLIAAFSGIALADVSGAGIIAVIGGTMLTAVLGIALVVVAASLIIKELIRRRNGKK